MEQTKFFVPFFNCGHKIEMTHVEMEKEVRYQYFKFGSVSSTHCPTCRNENIDERASEHAALKLHENGLRGA